MIDFFVIAHGIVFLYMNDYSYVIFTKIEVQRMLNINNKFEIRQNELEESANGKR